MSVYKAQGGQSQSPARLSGHRDGDQIDGVQTSRDIGRHKLGVPYCEFEGLLTAGM